MPTSITSLEKIDLGGIPQWISLRSTDINNPILLYLHGGPGTPVMPLFRHFQAPLEEHFLVVQWEQRGAGKSFSWKIPKQSMTIDQFISDLHELIKILRKRFNKEKIYLVAHSWGSVFGMKTVQQYPELFHAYVGVGQASNTVETEQLMYHFVLEQARERQDNKTLRKLKRIGPPFQDLELPYTKFYKGGYQAKMSVYSLVAQYGGIIYKIKRMNDMIKIVLKYLPLLQPEYHLSDLFRIIQGNIFSTKTMMKELLQIDLIKEVPELKVPVYFLMGRHDYNWSAELAKQYFDHLKAPQKEFIWFEHSAHAPNGEEPNKFNRLLIDKIISETFHSNYL